MGAPPLPDHYPLWQGPPYRGAPASPARRGPSRAKPRPLRGRELGVAVALPWLADLLLWSKRGFSSGGLGLALLFSLVHVNVGRVQSGELRPLLHVFAEAHEPESAAALLPLLEHPDPRIREGVAALLSRARARLHDVAARSSTWRERDVATARALAALDGAEARIAGALGSADPDEARRTLLDVVHVASGDGYLEARPDLPASAVREATAEVADEAR